MVRNTFWTECDSLIVQSPQDPQQANSPQGMAEAVEQWQWALWKPSKKGSGTSTSSCCPSGVLPPGGPVGPRNMWPLMVTQCRGGQDQQSQLAVVKPT